MTKLKSREPIPTVLTAEANRIFGRGAKTYRGEMRRGLRQLRRTHQSATKVMDDDRKFCRAATRQRRIRQSMTLESDGQSLHTPGLSKRNSQAVSFCVSQLEPRVVFAMGQCVGFHHCQLDDSADPKDHRCILHSFDPVKDAEAFQKALEEHRKRHANDFQFIVFPPKVGFQGETFSTEATFLGATFLGEAQFYKAVFAQGADFTATTFKGDAKFFQAEFSGGAKFNVATFEGIADFGCTIFSAGVAGEERRKPPLNRPQVFFDKTRFVARANFFRARFAGPAWFDRTKFAKEAVFAECRFEGPSGFVRVRFSSRANFLFTTFEHSTGFLSTTFCDEAYFEGTSFESGRVNFQAANFRGRALFSGKGEKEEEVREDIQRDAINLAAVIFKDWGREPTKRQFDAVVVDFRSVHTSQAKSFVFRYVNLEKCLFEDTDLRPVEFIDVVWPRSGGRWCAYDEDAPRNERGVIRTDLTDDSPAAGKRPRSIKKTGFPWASIERLYRELKRHHDERRDYQKAGDFHYGEKEMQRRNPQTPPVQRIILGLYKAASGYGERYFRPLAWAGVIGMVSALLYVIFGLRVNVKDGRYLELSSFSDMAHSALFSFRTMTLLRPDEYVPTGYAVMVSTFEALLGPLFLGLFALAVRQRLKR